VLRPSLLGSLLSSLRSNLRQRDRALLFELARTWHGDLHPLPDERRHIGIALSGPRAAVTWSSPNSELLDFFDLKGIVETLCAEFRAPCVFAPDVHAHLHPGRTAALLLGHQRIGLLGQLHPDLATRFDLEAAPVLVAEIDFESLLQAREPLPMVRTPSRFPPNDRDIALYVDESVSHDEVIRVIREAAGSLLESVRLFDIYRGGAGAAGRKSLAFALRYRASDRTLEEDEVARAHGAVEQAVQARLGAEVRGR
jgi:phenylalanyl-tRNA synthetase beta chain